MLPENRSFVVRGEDGEEYGPVELAELREWVQENRAGLGTEVRRAEPDSAWNSWQDYPELIALLAEAQATGAAPGPVLIVAPLWKRGLAFAFDLVLLLIPTILIFYTVVWLCFPDWMVRYAASANQFILDMEAGHEHPFVPPDPPQNALLVAELVRDVLFAFYFTGFTAAHGKTPGKALLHLRVVDQMGFKPDWTRCILRALILIFSVSLLFIPFAYAFFNPQRRALHDILAGTYVIAE